MGRDSPKAGAHKEDTAMLTPRAISEGVLLHIRHFQPLPVHLFSPKLKTGEKKAKKTLGELISVHDGYKTAECF